MEVVDYKKNLGLALKLYRVERDLSQEELASKANINLTYYGKVERSENSISIEKLQAISMALEIPLSDIFKRIEGLSRS